MNMYRVDPTLFLIEDVSRAIESARHGGSRLAVICLDLDRFSRLNASLGRTAGDQLLQAVAGRLLASLRKSDTVSHHKEDEFMVLATELDSTGQAALVATRLLLDLAKPFSIAENNLYLSASAGISVYPDNGLDADTLIRNAVAAMRHAKGRGGNNYQFFQRAMKARSVERLSLEEEFRMALERGEFLLHYQPRVNLETGETTGAEALLRWHHPARGLLYPEEFVPFAEDCGFIRPIGQWVLNEACRQAKAWMDAGLKPLPVSVNISPVEFRTRTFLDDVRKALEDSRLEPCYLEIELTDRVFMGRAEPRLSAILELKDMGVRLALDDFGYQFASLLHLRQFPIEALKIDQSLIRAVNDGADNTAIRYAVSKAISIGNNLKKRVIAEGVETQEQFDFLRSQRCGEGQGYYFCPPVGPEHFAKLRESERQGPPKKPSVSLAGVTMIDHAKSKSEQSRTTA